MYLTHSFHDFAIDYIELLKKILKISIYFKYRLRICWRRSGRREKVASLKGIWVCAFYFDTHEPVT